MTELVSQLQQKIDSLFADYFKTALYSYGIKKTGHGSYAPGSIDELFKTSSKDRTTEAFQEFNAAKKNYFSGKGGNVPAEEIALIDSVEKELLNFRDLHTQNLIDAVNIQKEHRDNEIKASAFNNPNKIIDQVKKTTEYLFKKLNDVAGPSEFTEIRKTIISDFEEEFESQRNKLTEEYNNRKPYYDQIARGSEELNNMKDQGLIDKYKPYYITMDGASSRALIECYNTDPAAKDLIGKRWQEITSKNDSLAIVDSYNQYGSHRPAIEITLEGFNNLNQNIYKFYLEPELKESIWNYDPKKNKYSAKFDPEAIDDATALLCRFYLSFDKKDRAEAIKENYLGGHGKGINESCHSAGLRAWEEITGENFNAKEVNSGYRMYIGRECFEVLQLKGYDLKARHPFELKPGVNWVCFNDKLCAYEHKPVNEATAIIYSGDSTNISFTFNILKRLSALEVLAQLIDNKNPENKPVLGEEKGEELRSLRLHDQCNDFIKGTEKLYKALTSNSKTDKKKNFLTSFRAVALEFQNAFHAIHKALEENAENRVLFTPFNLTEVAQAAENFEHLVKLSYILPEEGLKEFVIQVHKDRETDYYDKFESGHGPALEIENEFYNSIKLKKSAGNGKYTYEFCIDSDLFNRRMGGEKSFTTWVINHGFSKQMKLSGFGKNITDCQEKPFKCLPNPSDEWKDMKIIMHEDAVQAMNMQGYLKNSMVPLSQDVIQARFGTEWKRIFTHDNPLKAMIQTIPGNDGVFKEIEGFDVEKGNSLQQKVARKIG